MKVAMATVFHDRVAPTVTGVGFHADANLAAYA